MLQSSKFTDFTVFELGLTNRVGYIYTAPSLPTPRFGSSQNAKGFKGNMRVCII